MLRHVVAVVFATALLVASPAANGQSFNLDFGSNFGTPPAAYGAAAGQTGIWQEIPSLPAGGCGGKPPTGIPLIDVDGNATAANIIWSACSATTVPGFSFNNPGTSGSDQALLDDLLDLPNGLQLVLQDLEPGQYAVYVYAWAPDSDTSVTDVNAYSTACSAAGCTNDIGGAWPGGLEEEVVYELYALQIDPIPGFPYAQAIELDFTQNSGFLSLNAIQIVKLGPQAGSGPDLNGDGAVDSGDLALLLGAWTG